MKPIFELVTLYQGIFSLIIFTLLLIRIMYFEKVYTGRINNTWHEADIATKWIVLRFIFNFALFTLFALALLYVSSEDFFESSAWANKNPAIHLFSFKITPILLWGLMSLYTICVACECCIFSRKSILEEIDVDRAIQEEKYGKNRRRSSAF